MTNRTLRQDQELTKIGYEVTSMINSTTGTLHYIANYKGKAIGIVPNENDAWNICRMLSQLQHDQ